MRVDRVERFLMKRGSRSSATKKTIEKSPLENKKFELRMLRVDES